MKNSLLFHEILVYVVSIFYEQYFCLIYLNFEAIKELLICPAFVRKY